MDPRAHAARLDEDRDESRRCAHMAWRVGERDGAAGRSCRRLSRSLTGKYPRAPLDWATATGNQGVALMRLAERRGDARMAKLAVQQIEAALRHCATTAMRIRLPSLKRGAPLPKTSPSAERSSRRIEAPHLKPSMEHWRNIARRTRLSTSARPGAVKTSQRAKQRGLALRAPCRALSKWVPGRALGEFQIADVEP